MIVVYNKTNVNNNETFITNSVHISLHKMLPQSNNAKFCGVNSMFDVNLCIRMDVLLQSVLFHYNARQVHPSII